MSRLPHKALVRKCRCSNNVSDLIKKKKIAFVGKNLDSMLLQNSFTSLVILVKNHGAGGRSNVMKRNSFSIQRGGKIFPKLLMNENLEACILVVY